MSQAGFFENIIALYNQTAKFYLTSSESTNCSVTLYTGTHWSNDLSAYIYLKCFSKHIYWCKNYGITINKYFFNIPTLSFIIYFNLSVFWFRNLWMICDEIYSRYIFNLTLKALNAKRFFLVYFKEQISFGLN